MFRVKVQESAKSKQFYEFSVKNPIKSWLIIARDISADQIAAHFSLFFSTLQTLNWWKQKPFNLVQHKFSEN